MLRSGLAQSLSTTDTLATCWQLGQQAADLSTAFFIGYQAAMRCLDVNLPATAWAALAVSERGVKSPFDSLTVASMAEQHLEGQKSHVMLAGQGLDVVYILAKEDASDPVQLHLYKLQASQVSVGEAVEQPFVQALKHYPIVFSVPLAQVELVTTKAHQEANKPFRYWEDVHLIVAYAAWLKRQLSEDSELLLDAVAELKQEFFNSPSYYSLPVLDAFEHLLKALETTAQQLNAEELQQWQQDSVLFRFTQSIRDKVRQRLLTN